MFAVNDTDVSYVKLLINSDTIEFDDYWTSIKGENASVLKVIPNILVLSL